MPRLHLCAVALLALLFSAPAHADIVITIDKAAQRMSVSVDGIAQHDWPVSTGRAGYLTPAGNFTPFRLEEDHFSKEWDEAPMPHSIFFTPRGHAIHGSLEVKKLGSPASAGCVRLAPKNAAVLFALVKSTGLNKTKVVITGEEQMIARRAPARERPPAGAAPEADDGVRVYSGDAVAPLRNGEYVERRRYYVDRVPPPVAAAPRGYYYQQRPVYAPRGYYEYQQPRYSAPSPYGWN